jgi:hypothetical protein
MAIEDAAMIQEEDGRAEPLEFHTHAGQRRVLFQTPKQNHGLCPSLEIAHDRAPDVG